ncbi:MAG: hypothetical protein M1840_000657 [Geoglossum simile]|nr:MAG: hypothetical protein M1840_000657 [Geoglossum simile]
MHPKSAILYANPAKTIFLLDIPTSISLAANPNHTLLSSTPPSQPYTLPEPKTATARARVLSSYGKAEGRLEYEEGVRRDLEQVLGEIERNWEGEWCAPRVVGGEAGNEKKGDVIENQRETGLDFQTYAQNLAALSHFLPPLQEAHPFTLPLSSTPPPDLSDIYNQTLTNPFPTAIPLTLHSPPNKLHTFTIPALSTFHLTHISPSSPAPFPTTEPFTLILLDPPWPNKSAQRHKAYTTSTRAPEMGRLLSSLPQKLPLAPNGAVAVWITNNPTHRGLVLDKKTGLFARWGLQPAEEWLWLKTTPAGQPIFPLSSLWRKPYETLLIGRRPSSISSLVQSANTPPLRDVQPRRRVIASVPDLHSRKPHLQEVLRETGCVGEGERVVEVFGRCLTRGWWGWGNEAIRGNWVGCWVEDGEDKGEY